MTHQSEVAHSLASALADDPFYRAITVGVDDANLLEVLARYFCLAIDEARGIGAVVSADTRGAAIWLTYEADRATIDAAVGARQRATAALLGSAGFDNYTRISAAMSANVPVRLGSAWYLSILGVHPLAQGRGLARTLLAPTLRRADELGQVSYLETYNPSSLPFYERAGFLVAEHCFEEITDRPYWILVREPALAER